MFAEKVAKDMPSMEAISLRSTSQPLSGLSLPSLFPYFVAWPLLENDTSINLGPAVLLYAPYIPVCQVGSHAHRLWESGYQPAQLPQQQYTNYQINYRCSNSS